VNLRDTTRDRFSVSQVECLIGYPVGVVEDDTLQTQMGFECAMLSRRGMDINKSEPKHTLHRLLGEYRAHNVVSFLYVAFQQFAPDMDLGVDLAREYRMAQEMKR